MRTSRKTTLVGVSTVALLGSGVALAAWTSNGTGTGSVTAGEATVLKVEAGAAKGALVPGGTQTISFSVMNPGSYAVTLRDLATTVSVTGAGCTIENSAVSAVSLHDLTEKIAPGATVVKDVAVSMGVDSDNACQLATFDIAAKAVGVSS